MRKRFCAILTVLVLALLSSCPVFAKGRTIRSIDRRFEVEVPKKWSDMSGKLDPSGGTDRFYMIEAGSDKSQAYIVFKEEDLDRVVLKTFDDYFNALSSGIAASSLLTDVRLSSSEDQILDGCGMLCRKCTFSATWQPDDGKAPAGIAGWIYAVQGGEGTCYQFFGWTKSGNALDMGPVFDSIVHSFRILA